MEETLDNSSDILFDVIDLGEVDIDISGKVCRASLTRNGNGNIEITLIDEGIFEENGWLPEGFTTEGFNDEIIIGKFSL